MKKLKLSIIAVLISTFFSGVLVMAQVQSAAVTGGRVEGVLADGVVSFKGIPFAAPPMGDLRWKAPQPLKPWSGVKKADSFGAKCMQNAEQNFWGASRDERRLPLPQCVDPCQVRWRQTPGHGVDLRRRFLRRTNRKSRL